MTCIKFSYNIDHSHKQANRKLTNVSIPIYLKWTLVWLVRSQRSFARQLIMGGRIGLKFPTVHAHVSGRQVKLFTKKIKVN